MIKIIHFSKDKLADHWAKLEVLLLHKPPIGLNLLKTICDTPSGCEIETFIACDEQDNWIGNVTLFHAMQTGLVGNVFVQQTYRGSGIGDKLMAAVTQFGKSEKHSHHVLWVSPKKRPTAFQLYLKHGYQNAGDNGVMVKEFFPRTKLEEDNSLQLTALTWRHYPQLNLLTSQGACGILASFMHSCYGVATFETEFYLAMTSQEQGWAIENNGGEAVGAIFVAKNQLWNQQREAEYNNPHYHWDLLLDEDYLDECDALLATFPFASGLFSTYTITPSKKQDMLLTRFLYKTTFKRHFCWQGKDYDVALLEYDTRQ